MTAKDLTVTTALPPRGREEAVLRVAAKYEPSVLRIVASVPMPNFRRPLDLHRFLLHRERTLKRLDAAAALARTMVRPQTNGRDRSRQGPPLGLPRQRCGLRQVMVVPARSSVDLRARTSECITRDGRVVVAVADRDPVMSS